MAHFLQSEKWIGYAALCFAVLVILAFRFHFGTTLAGVCLVPLGFYCGVRGLFVGPWYGRVCAGLSMVVWLLGAYGILVAMSKVS